MGIHILNIAKKLDDICKQQAKIIMLWQKLSFAKRTSFYFPNIFISYYCIIFATYLFGFLSHKELI